MSYKDHKRSLTVALACTALAGAFSVSADHHNFEDATDRDAQNSALGIMSNQPIQSVDGTGRLADDNTIRSVDGTGLRSTSGSTIDSVDGTGALNEIPAGTIRSVDGTGRLRGGTDLAVASSGNSDELRSVDGTGRLQQVSPQSSSSSFGIDSDDCNQGASSPVEQSDTSHSPVDDSGCNW